MNRFLRAAPLAGAALVVAGALVFFTLFETVDEEQDVAARGEAASNPYFTAQELLRGLGVKTTSRYGLGEPPPTNEVVVVLTTDNDHRAPLAPRLFTWVSAGGHLVVVPTEERTAWDTLLGLLDGDPETARDTGWNGQEAEPTSQPRRAPGDPTPSAPTDAGDEESPPQDDLLAAFGILLTDRWTGDPALQVTVDPPGSSRSRRLQLHQVPLGVQWTEIEGRTEPSDLQVWPAHGRQLDRTVYAVAERDVGQGRVSVLADRHLLDNASVGRADHALFLTDLLASRGTPAGVLFVLSGDSPNIAGLVWRAAWPAVVALTALLVAWGRRVSQRFGPISADTSRTRRSLLEHIDATGQFLWHQGAGQELLDSARRRLRLRLRRRFPDLGEAEDSAFVAAVAARVGVLPEVAETALLSTPPTGDVRSCLTALRAVQTVWSHA